MRCINAVNGFCHGFEFVAADNILFHLNGSATAALAHMAVSDFTEMRKAGQADAEQMVIRLSFGTKKTAPENQFNKVTVVRADVALVDDRIVFRPEADDQCSDLLVLFQTDHLRYRNSGLAALDGAVVLSRALLDDGKEIVLARMPPGSALRGYIDHKESHSVRRQYISNLALCSEGRELMSHG